MPTTLLTTYAARHNESIRTGDFAALAALFAPNAELHFAGLPIGPFIGRPAILHAFATHPPDDELILSAIQQTPTGERANYAWKTAPTLIAGTIDLTPNPANLIRLLRVRTMTAILVRIGIDQAWGGWNAPVDPSTRAFVYVPITESATKFHPDCGRTLPAFVRALARFCESCECKSELPSRPPCDVRAPSKPVHLDPDFEHLTYGDNGQKRGAGIAKLAAGDLLVFYAGLRPCGPWTDTLMYAIVGLYVVDEVVSIARIPPERWHENAHTRRIPHSEWPRDIIVRGRAEQSGKLQKCIPIGEWRERAYRVRDDLLKEWGGLSVKNGYIQRSAVPPHFLDPERFRAWFKKQAVDLVARNF